MTSFRIARHNAAQQERMVQMQVSPDFMDPVHEWRRLFAEIWGTFLLVVIFFLALCEIQWVIKF